jgi:hypothetical protein
MLNCIISILNPILYNIWTNLSHFSPGWTKLRQFLIIAKSDRALIPAPFGLLAIIHFVVGAWMKYLPFYRI